MKQELESRLADLLFSLGGVRIAVIGDLILDEFIWGKVDRISPEAPVPVVEVTRESVRLGGAANVALNLLALGAEPRLVGVIGGDAAGDRFLEVLRNSGIDSSGVIVDSKRHTTIKTRIIAHHQQVCRADRENKAQLTETTRNQVADASIELLNKSDAVVISDYAKGVLDEETTPALIRECGRLQKFTAVDPKLNSLALYRGASVVTPNKREAERASSIAIVDQESLVRAGRRIIQLSGAENLLITKGEEGMTLFEGSESTEISTVAKEVYDVTGAGDTVIAALTLAVAGGATLYEAAILANHAAGVVVGKLGTASVGRQELVESLTSGVGSVGASRSRRDDYG
jgi:D-beta-D-heptose 7-phosphate kinase/D-beta-D-heptose 1-phosphate adenosyltransferase